MATTNSVSAVHGWTSQPDAEAALDEIFQGHDLSSASLALVFASSDYDLSGLGSSLQKRFTCPVIGCSTAGEISNTGYEDSGIVAAAVWGVDVAVQAIRDLGCFDEDDATALATQLGTHDISHSEHAVLITLLDGLCMREEEVSSKIYLASGGVPMIGGSSGDSLSFDDTSVLVDGEFVKGAGLCALIRAECGLQTFIGHHYEDTESILVVTRADPNQRVIHELNGLPAADAYAKAIGKSLEQLSKADELLHPLMVKAGERFYVRGVQQLREDGSIQLYCAIDEGVVLHVGRADRAHEKLSDHIKNACIGVDPQLVLLFDCITRRLETDQLGTNSSFTEVLQRYPAIGFSTYGEQYNGVHVNQTVTGIVFGGFH
ncbi:MAG: FIST N-terminal domain-containing protein [Phycisphaerales bacterium]